MTDVDDDDDYAELFGQRPKTGKGSRLLDRRKLLQRQFQALLAFQWNDAAGGLIAQPQRTFKPKGLILWDTPESSLLTQALVGNNYQLVSGWGPVPCRWFEQWKSYQQIADAFEKGIEPAGWGTWDVCEVGVQIRLQFQTKDGQNILKENSAKPIQACMWGIELR